MCTVSEKRKNTATKDGEETALSRAGAQSLSCLVVYREEDADGFVVAVAAVGGAAVDATASTVCDAAVAAIRP